MKVALCVGHSRRINGKRDGGAVSTGNVNEWTYNRELADMIAARLPFDVVIVSDYQGSGYTTAMKWLAKHLKDLKVDVALELHFNAASESARGHEWLCYHSSIKGERLAKDLDIAFRRHVPEIKARGVKRLSNGDRGNEFVKLTHCPAVIGEPGFGSNTFEWKIMVDKKPQIADAYAEGLTKWIAGS